MKITTTPAAGSLKLSGNTVSANDVISAANIGNLVYTPAANGNGTGYASFTFQVQDNGGTSNGGVDLDSTPNTMTIDVTSVNDAPTATSLTDQAVRFDNALSYNASTVFSDVDGNTLSYSATLSGGGALPAWLNIDSSTGVLSGTPAWSDRGTYTVTVTASDSPSNPTGALSTTATVRIAVTEIQAGVLLISANSDETLVGVTANDTVSYVLAGSAVTANVATGATGGGGTDTFTGIENIIGSAFGDTLNGDGNDNKLDGLGGNDTITGGAGNDILNGGDGTDTLSGGIGDDSYILDATSGGDTIVENEGEGIDLIWTNATMSALPANVENLVLTGGALDINGAGNGLDNDIIGNAGNNILNGGDGNDKLAGKDGSDTLNGGNGDDSLLGGNGNDTLNGDAGNDRLDGGAGQDTMSGGSGDDVYIVDNVSDSIVENSSEGIDRIESSVTFTLPANVERLKLTGASAINGTGNALANVITGNAGNNVLAGGDGKDNLTGGAGEDIFVFANFGASHKDTVTDFSVADDTIQLDNLVFTALTVEGTLNADNFKLGTAAGDSNDYVIYDSATGNLFYDADGTGAVTAKLIATLSAGLSMTNADIVVI